ncbi:MAG: anaerobic ribonucleoside triphosphate reductase [Candidatus Nomurabacteria bacterium]|jgi:ribonucleoside-triphosphate reductase|nr:anaerobic ribonucleoside triphosphate reductase [Candidatus Nomurabacteria bacterium]
MYKFIKKRDGRKAKFTPEKIVTAISKAGQATGEFDQRTALKLADRVLDKAEKELGKAVPTVEQVQDIVEDVLMNSKFHETAKAYILYRNERTRAREGNSRLIQTYRTIAHAMAEDNSDVKRSNANVDSNTAMGKMLQFGAEGSKEFAAKFLLNPKFAEAHSGGDIHIHDLDFWATGTLTCCQTDPIELFKDGGFNTGHGFLRTPNSISSYAALAAIILQANQNEQHGGQSIPNFDYAMAEGVNKTYRKAVKSNFEKYARFAGKKTAALDEQKLAKLEYDEKMGGLPIEIFEEAKVDADKQTAQAMEGFVHNLNTMHSRAGAQVPFTSINFGTDTSRAGHLVSDKLLDAINSGLGHGETAIFPIAIFKVKEGLNYNPEDPNYDLFKKSMAVSAKRLFPNFVFLDAPFNLQYYKSGDYHSEVATMGCRTRVMASVFPETDGRATGRGNCSFTTINLPRIGIKHGTVLGKRKAADWKGFYKELDEKLELVAAQLLERYEFQAKKYVRNFPFLMGQGVWVDSGKLGPNDTLRDVIKHGTLSIGFIGLAECLKAMLGAHHGESEEAQARGVEIVKFMRDKCDKLAEEYSLNFSLLATPAEGLAGRFTKIDRKQFGEIVGVTDRDFYTNSYHVPVYHHIGAFDKIDREAPYHALCNAGHITYIELDGDPSQNLDAFETVIRHMKEAGIGYGSINHPVDRDPVCSFSGIIEGEYCPSCGRHEHDGEYGFERLRRITGYLVGSLERWNDGKQAEEAARVKHSVAGVYNKAEKSAREAAKRTQTKALGKA